MGAGRRVAEVLAIGDEFVHGQKVDTNSAWLARELCELGYEVARLTVASDGEVDLASAIADACRRSDVVVATGGLGPTEDDRTRVAAARVAGVGLRFDEGSWRSIQAMFELRGRGEPPVSNRRQASFPEGADVVPNRWGTAPGFRMRVHDADFFAMPGVPREMRAIWNGYVRPAIVHDARAAHYHCMQVIGCHEAKLGEMLGGYMLEGRDPKVGVTASGGQLTVRIAGYDGAAVGRTVDELRPVLGELLVYEGAHTLAEEVGRLLIERGATVALAESCTGGLIAAALTDVPGISAVFLAGFVTYSNAAKVRDLGVPEATLAAHGAVSEPVVAAMAAGAARRAGARCAVSVSGIAGPDGGSDERPVGTVCFGVTVDGVTETYERRFGQLGRELLRQRSVREALLLLYRRVR